MFESTTDRARLLIIDDEEAIRTILLQLFEKRYVCTTAGSAEEALELLAAGEFDLVLSDINMSGMSGLEMLPRVKELAPETVVVMISGLQSIETAIEAIRAGAYDYITKPFDLLDVEAVIKRAIEYHELRRAKKHYEKHLEELVVLRTQELNQALDSLEDSYRSTLAALAHALEARDHETHGHSERVVAFSLRLGRELGLSRAELRALEFGALLHDIGKIGVPDAILHKPGKLNEEEWATMRLHPLHGERILRSIKFLEGAAQVVGGHHEQWNGSGYPRGLKGEEIPLNARIFAVADTFDAITSDRVYRAAQPYEAAAAELDRFSGRQFDPAVVAAFHRVSREEWDEIRSLSRASADRRAGLNGHYPPPEAPAAAAPQHAGALTNA